MPDNSAEIAKIRKILRTGATSASIDGRTVQYDFDELRRQLRELIETDDALQGQRPLVSRIRLGNF